MVCSKTWSYGRGVTRTSESPQAQHIRAAIAGPAQRVFDILIMGPQDRWQDPSLCMLNWVGRDVKLRERDAPADFISGGSKISRCLRHRNIISTFHILTNSQDTHLTLSTTLYHLPPRLYCILLLLLFLLLPAHFDTAIMSERKVLTKYYPPDFDPSKITRTPKHLRPTGPKLMTVRLMAPFSMKCTSCGEYIYKGRKFNARKETTDETYLRLPIYRFYIRCTRCSSEITFKTDPKNMDYTCERGAKRNFEPWRDPESKEMKETDEERLARLEQEEAEEMENAERNAMEELEQKMVESKREMAIADALDEIRTRNARIERGERGGKEEVALSRVRDEAEEARLRAQKEDEEAARAAFEVDNVARARREEENLVNGHTETGVAEEGSTSPAPVASFERVKKVKKVTVPGLVKKVDSISVQPPAATTLGLGLGGYDSESD